MIKTLTHAISVQTRRADAGKTGHAKAVCRYLKRNHADNYQAVKASLPECLGYSAKTA